MTAPQELPRVRWRFRFPIGGFISGMLGGFGVLVFLQQSAILYPELGITIGFVLGGGLLTVLIRNVASRIGVTRLNSRLDAAERKMAAYDAGGAAAAAAPAPVHEEPAPVVEPPVAAAAVVEEHHDEHVSDATEAWAATHVVPSHGMPAWSEADKSGPPVTQLEAGLELRVIERANGLAHVEAYNGWTAWVDGRSLRRKH